MNDIITNEDIHALAKALDVVCYSWNPGREMCYEFTYANGLFKCHGEREAWTWLKGYEAGRNE